MTPIPGSPSLRYQGRVLNDAPLTDFDSPAGVRLLVCLEVLDDPRGTPADCRLAAALKTLLRAYRLRAVWLADPAAGRGRWNPTMWSPGEGV